MSVDALTTIRVGHSPDSDDAFMFYALTHDKLDTGGLRFVHQLEDIETLNRAPCGVSWRFRRSVSTRLPTWRTDMRCWRRGRAWGIGTGRRW